MDSESELRNLSELETKLGEVMFSFSDIVPENLREWFTVYSSSHGTTRELLLLSVLTSTSALVGKTVVEVFSTYEERANLFLIAIAPSGSGKTPACHLGCTDPVVSYLERKVDMALLLDETSANGLFNHYVSSPLVPIICVDEAHTFLTKMACPSKSSQVHLSMERLCKLFDGDFWYVLKGNKSKRSGVPSAMASLLAFTTPRQFLEKVWPKILSAENGLAERVLFYYQVKIDKDLEMMASLCQQLEDLPVKSLNVVFEKIFNEHNQDVSLKYSLSASTREAFFKFAKPQENVIPASQSGVAPQSKCTNAKRNTHVLRVALNMHILYEHLQKASVHEVGATSKVISLQTLNMAIALVETLETYKGVSEECCHLKPSEAVKLGISNSDIQKRVLEIPGPYTTVKRVYTSFTSRNRPTALTVKSCMEDLQKQGLGTYKCINKLHCYYKNLPSEGLKPLLSVHGISLDSYIAILKVEDERMTSRNRDCLLDNHSNRAELEAFLSQSL